MENERKHDFVRLYCKSNGKAGTDQSLCHYFKRTCRNSTSEAQYLSGRYSRTWQITQCRCNDGQHVKGGYGYTDAAGKGRWSDARTDGNSRCKGTRQRLCGCTGCSSATECKRQAGCWRRDRKRYFKCDQGYGTEGALLWTNRIADR